MATGMSAFADCRCDPGLPGLAHGARAVVRRVGGRPCMRRILARRGPGRGREFLRRQLRVRGSGRAGRRVCAARGGGCRLYAPPPGQARGDPGRGVVRLVPAGVEQPGRRFCLRIHHRAGPVRGCPAAGRARHARLPRRPGRLVAWPAGPRARLRRFSARARPARRRCLRPCRPGLCAVPAQPAARRRRQQRRVREPQPGRDVPGSHLVRSTPARRRLAAPVVVAGCVYLGVVAADFAHSLHRGYLGNDGLDRRLWLGEAAALCALSLAVIWAWVRARRTRSALARLVIELAESPPPGGLRDVLADVLRDPSLQLAYPLAGGRIADARCRPVELTGEVTPIVRGGQRVALLSHRPGLLAEPALADEVAATARLALDNERLQAEAWSQLEDLRASRARIVQSGDAERRRLVRDLHDGAQQQFVTLSLALRLARTRSGPGLDPALAGRLDLAEAELRAALADLRELA